MRRAANWLVLCFLVAGSALGQTPPPAPGPAQPAAAPAPVANEAELGEFIVTSKKQEKLPRIAVLPSLSPDLEDVMVRSVVRHDIELTGMFDIIKDADAPPGMYSFDDPVDIEAWKKLGAEAIVKVAARGKGKTKVEVFGIAYFLNVGKDPVYQKKLTVDKDNVRVTAHRRSPVALARPRRRDGALGRPSRHRAHGHVRHHQGR